MLHIPCRTRQTNAEMCEYRLNKSGTIRAVCKACPSPYIRIPYKLTRKIYNLLSGTCSCGSFFLRPYSGLFGFFRKSRFLFFFGLCIGKHFFLVLCLGILHHLLRFLLCTISYYNIFRIHITGHFAGLNLGPFSYRTKNLRGIIRIQLTHPFTFRRRFTSDIKKRLDVGECHI